MMIDSAFILAAGKGERLRPLTDTCPKPLLPLPGGSALSSWLDMLSDMRRIVINVHHLAEQIIRSVSDHSGVIVSHEFQLLDSGGGIRHALPYFDSPFFVVNADIVGDIQLMRRVLELSWCGFESARLLVAPTPSTHSGDFEMDASQRLSRSKGGPWTFTGFHIATPKAYRSFGDGHVFSNNLVWDLLQDEGRLYGTPFDGKWLDIGTPDLYKMAQDSKW